MLKPIGTQFAAILHNVDVDQEREHNDFHYATDSEWDRAAAYELGAANPERAWILTDRDVWHRNPAYQGPPVPHPESDCED